MSYNSLKACSSCKKNKPLTEFNKNKSKKDGLNTICRKCSNSNSKKYYSVNKKRIIKQIYESRMERIRFNKQFIYDFLSETGCIDCGIKNPIVLEFDHMSSKIECISKMVNNGESLLKLKKEISKCVVRCANCHRIKTAKDFNWYAGLITRVYSV